MSIKKTHSLIRFGLSFMAMSFAVHASETTYTTSTPPLPVIKLANFAITDEPFEFNTANAAGIKTYWAGKLSISKSGIITGLATVETYASNGDFISKNNKVLISSGSKIFAAANILPALNYKVEDNSGGGKEQSADHRADIIVKFSNGFVARGKIIYEYDFSTYASYTYDYDYLSGNTTTTTITGYSGYDNSDVEHSLSVTGPNGHIGF